MLPATLRIALQERLLVFKMISPKRILITGANGLLGRHAVASFSQKYKIHAVVRRLPEKTVPGVDYHVLDLAQPIVNSKLPEKMDTVIHLAQSDSFREFPDKASDIFNVNVGATANLLDYSYKSGVKTFILASSGGVYGTSSNAFHEDFPLTQHGDLGFYLGSKLCGEVLAQSYMAQMDVITLRFFFMYGAGQKRSMLIPRLVDNISNGQPINLDGTDGLRINPIHVSDAVAALEASLGVGSSSIINIAGPEVLSLRDISNLIGQRLQKDPVFKHTNAEPKHLVANIDNMKSKLVSPRVTVEMGIQDVLI